MLEFQKELQKMLARKQAEINNMLNSTKGISTEFSRKYGELQNMKVDMRKVDRAIEVMARYNSEAMNQFDESIDI